MPNYLCVRQGRLIVPTYEQVLADDYWTLRTQIAIIEQLMIEELRPVCNERRACSVTIGTFEAEWFRQRKNLPPRLSATA